MSARVTSAVALSDAQRAQIESAIKASGAKSVELHEEVNPDLIGGLVVRVEESKLTRALRKRCATWTARSKRIYTSLISK